MQAQIHKYTDSATVQRWLTFKTAMEYVGVSEMTLRNWARVGSFKLHNVTPRGGRGRVLIDRFELDAFIERFAGAPASSLAMNICKEGAL